MGRVRCATGRSESAVRVILCQGLLKSARFEWILEKGTELGVATFVPTLCHRSMAGLEGAGKAKIQRWQRILEESVADFGKLSNDMGLANANTPPWMQKAGLALMLAKVYPLAKQELIAGGMDARKVEEMSVAQVIANRVTGELYVRAYPKRHVSQNVAATYPAWITPVTTPIQVDNLKT